MPDSTPPSASSTKPDEQRGRILILEDDPAVSRFLVREVESKRPSAVAFTVAAAKALFDKEAFSAVISDENLPDGSGLAWLAELRGQGWFGPVLLLTGQFEKEVANRAQSLGAQCVFKPPQFGNVALFLESVTAREKTIAERLESVVQSLIKTHELTRREADTLRTACSGVRRTDLHTALGVSENTAKSHVRALLSRLNESKLDDVIQRVLRAVLTEHT